MDRFLGVDGGATSTTCVVATEEGMVLGVGYGGPSNHILAPGGRDRARAALAEALDQATGQLSPRPTEFRAAHLGMTGINRDTPQARALLDVARELLSAQTIGVSNDAEVALAGALACRPGVVLIAGTGSVAFGRDGTGKDARAGGWGYLFGDEGSAFALGRDGVRAALAARDGTGPPTALVDLLPKAAGMDLQDIPLAFYEGRLGRPHIAALAPAVTLAAAEGDHVARKLVEEAAEALARLATAVIGRLTWPEATMAVATVGGVFRAGPVVLAPLRRALSAQAGGAILVPPRFAPALGAVLLAFQLAGVEFTPTRLALLAATWEMRTAGRGPRDVVFR
jgi:N-acetylglucosamine kinase-like BadF-type ATPase